MSDMQMLDVRVRMYLYRWNVRGVDDALDVSCETYSMHVCPPSSGRPQSSTDPNLIT